MKPGVRGRICSLEGCRETCDPLRRMGFHEGALVERLSHDSDPVMFRCGGACVAVCSSLLTAVTVVTV